MEQRSTRRHHHATRIREDAVADLRLIREAMDHSSRFTDVPGVGMVVIGGTRARHGLAGCCRGLRPLWVAIWGFELALAVAIGLVAIALKARAAGTAGLCAAGRRFLRGMIAPLAAGAVLTAFFVKVDAGQSSPALCCCSTALRCSPAAPSRCASSDCRAPASWWSAWLALFVPLRRAMHAWRSALAACTSHSEP